MSSRWSKLSRTDKIRETERAKKWRASNPEKARAIKKKQTVRMYGKYPDRYEKDSERNKKLRAEYKEFLRPYLEEPCLDCKKCYDTRCMQFDHARGVKLFCISSGYLRPRRMVLAEIDKCDVVCANCHNIRTQERGQHRMGRRRGRHVPPRQIILAEHRQLGLGL